MSAYTKGPWEVDRRASTRVTDGADTTIASAGMASRTMEDAQANARLIASAPDLLEALKRASGLIGGGSLVQYSAWADLCRAIDAAIDKAEGK